MQKLLHIAVFFVLADSAGLQQRDSIPAKKKPRACAELFI